MIRFLLLAALAYIFLQVARFFINVRRYAAPSTSRPKLTGKMVKDEACQTYLPEEEAIKERIGQRLYYFCSQECRRRFLEENKKKKANQK